MSLEMSPLPAEALPGPEAGSLLIIGAARSGVAACRLALARGWRVSVCDDLPLQPKTLQLLRELGATAVDPPMLPGDTALVIPSPSVPMGHPLLQIARGRGLPVRSEVDFARAHFPGRVFGITGSNGKTTSALLGASLLCAAGIRARACGNIGLPFSSVALGEPELEWAVVELSSYQLETSCGLAADAALITNISPDHLDRHGSMAEYLAAKLRLPRQLKPGGIFVTNAGQPELREAARAFAGPTALWGRDPQLDAWIGEEGLFIRGEARRPCFPRRDLQLRGDHNLENVAGVMLGLRMAGITADDVRAAVRAFRPVAHRVELVYTWNGIAWINDSKATNPEATRAALEGFSDGSVILLVGGQAKTGDYSEMAELLRRKVRLLLVYGRDGGMIGDWFAGDPPTIECVTLERAVREAGAAARPGDTVLLSPMCASFDQFRDFEQRGDIFKQLAIERRGD
jgi:UDP-N-acetylmuramoylalanine--D-glutamate ligase